METLDSRLKSLRMLDPEQRLSVLVETIGLCSDHERAQVALELVELAMVRQENAPPRSPGVFARLRKSVAENESPHLIGDRALVELVVRWSLLDPDLRRAAISMASGRWSAAASGISVESNETARRSAVLLAEESADPGLASVCAALMHDPEVSIAAAAGRALVTIVRSLGEQTEVVEPDVLRAMSSINVHRCRGAAVAAMTALTPRRLTAASRGPLGEWFLGKESEAHAALRSALRSDRGPASSERAWEWLKLGRFASASGDRLRALNEESEFDPLLERWHLLRNPARGREWRSLRGSGRAVPLPAPNSVAKPTFRRGLIELAVAGDVPVRRSIAQAALLDEEPAVRWAAARLAETDELVDMCFDADARVARSALLRWSAVGELGHGGRAIGRVGVRNSPPRRRWLSKLARLPHASVRWTALAEARSTDWLDAGSPGGRATAHASLRADRSGVIERLREQISSSDDAQATRGIQCARRLGLVSQCEDLIARIATESGGAGGQALPRAAPARARATAVIALGSVASERSAESLRACVRDPEPRVRANAVEALGKLIVGSGVRVPSVPELATGVLIEFKNDDEHRARANALRALIAAARGGDPAERARGVAGVIELKPRVIAERELADHVLSMLGDARVMHRLAGAWLSVRLMWGHSAPGTWTRWSALTARLGELSRGDADARVRARAAHGVAMASAGAAR